MQIINLTPHPVTIIRGAQRTEYPACAPGDLPRAQEAPHLPGFNLIYDDTQGAYATGIAYDNTGLVDQIGYVGVEGLPPVDNQDLAYGARKAYIVSIVTVIGAIAAGRPTFDLLVPMGQVRDASGRIIGATSLGAADVLLDPMALGREDRPVTRCSSAAMTIG